MNLSKILYQIRSIQQKTYLIESLQLKPQIKNALLMPQNSTTISKNTSVILVPSWIYVVTEL